MSVHYRKKYKTYSDRRKRPGCPFCDKNRMSTPIYEDDLVIVIHNLTKYDIWELHDVSEHLLVIPKRHIKSLTELTDAERLAVMDACAVYEAKGYNVYARGVGFKRRSVEHQHTHLIKATNKDARFSIFIRKPYLLIKK